MAGWLSGFLNYVFVLAVRARTEAPLFLGVCAGLAWHRLRSLVKTYGLRGRLSEFRQPSARASTSEEVCLSSCLGGLVFTMQALSILKRILIVQDLMRACGTAVFMRRLACYDTRRSIRPEDVD